ncbi:Beta-galactosidase C-terminal domain [Paenibacillus sp. N4]|nr:Beta-galactosidase C-terminal domain [Paenibacillus vietnamensis]
MNHNAEASELQLQAEPRRDLLTGELVSGTYRLSAKGVMIIEE